MSDTLPAVGDLLPRRQDDAACIVWLTGGSCEGCTMAMLGATAPRLEELLSGHLTHIPRVELVHPVLAVEAGERYLERLRAARDGELGSFLLVVEGAVFTEPDAPGSFFSRLGERDGEPLHVRDWVLDLAGAAAAVIAIGTCATDGGIPAARGSVTGAHGLAAVLGADFVTSTGLPVINVPGCAPSGDAFIEVVSYVLLHLGGIVPLDLDERHRPRWLYGQDTPVVGIGGTPTSLHAACPVPGRGWINRLGGCGAVGGECTGCTRPDFPDVPLRALRGT